MYLIIFIFQSKNLQTTAHYNSHAKNQKANRNYQNYQSKYTAHSTLISVQK